MHGEQRLLVELGLGFWLAACGPHRDPTGPARSHDASLGPPALGDLTLPRRRAARRGDIGYHVTVLPSNLRPIGSAAPAFAAYLNQIHKRVHRVFADGFLTAADRRSVDDPLRNLELATTVELIIDGASGRVVGLQIRRASGLTEFDGGVVASIDRAAPFGPAPPEIHSPDGNVHLLWELRRDAMACSALGMHPLLFNSAGQ